MVEERRHVVHRVIWAPWRMAYLEGETPEGCFLCRAWSDPDEPLVVWRGVRCFVILNRFPYNPGHLLVAPAEHVGDYARLDEELAAELDRTARRVVAALEAELAPHGFNLGYNLGAAAGAGVPEHLHLHVVPRWNGDTNFMPVLADVKVLPEHLHATAEKLRRRLAKEPSS